MKKQKRRSIFETNSSSTHSITINNSKPVTTEELLVSEDNKVHVSFGEFGWEICDYPFQYEKLQYILTMCACTEGRKCTSPNEFFETEGYKSISNAVAEHCHCDGIEVEESSIKVECYENKIYLDFDGYIDHQSCGYSSVVDFLEENHISSVEEFIFDSSVVVHTDNDNH